MGTVWEASDELLGRSVAVKELHVGDGTESAGALREARTVAQIKHPHVVVVHDVVEHDGRPCIVMELVEGRSLADRLAADGPLDPAETARTGLALLGALNAAHARGVLHRDIKPANVLLEAGTGRVVLTDFGIARLAGATTISETGAFVGSPEYTSPERMQGAVAGPEADLWSLGVLLCAALTGESPFHRDSLGGVLHAVVYDEIRPPAQAGPLLPVIRGLLERDPERRLGAAEAERLLSAYVTTGTVPLVDRVPDPTPARAVRPVRRLWLIAAALVVVAVAGGVTAASLLGDRTEGRAHEVTPSAPAGASPATATPATVTPATASPGAGVTPKPAPTGYRIVTDPQGFALAVPTGYQRTTDDQRVFHSSPDGAIRIGIKVTPSASEGPLGAMRRADAAGPDTNPGYRDRSVVATTHNGLPAALWEFTWDGFTRAEGARHTFDLCWDEDGRMYDVWVSAPVSRLAEARSRFDAALDSFVTGGAASARP
ncbi:serine/threonine-protein kinase [Streptomyces sp. NBC_00162]|uniref:serine/threonine-protein kinase n=1 Tax=Streptomyces sp. NBC_00162 TaxID=2903629 RepID=UPI00214D0022|nr:serine/threonine-protein kinase [Streptomyces sp. NBC_00162]UUU39058.1 serine/threonine protein kinase [Streptomyces sp. NBC_00162]